GMDKPKGGEWGPVFGGDWRFPPAVRWNSRKRRDRRSKRSRLRDLAPVEHVLQAVAESADIVGIVLHLVNHGVVFRGGERDCRFDVGRRESRQRMPALFQRADHAIEPRKFSHSFPPSMAGAS